MNIRAMTEADVPATIDLWRSSEGVGLSEGDTVDGVCRFLSRNPGTSWVVVADEHVRGAILAGHDGRRGFLYHLTVRAEFRSRGWGTALVENCLGSLRDAGVLKCHVMVYRDNAQGRAFWTRLGFRLRSDIDICTRTIELVV